ncbi:HEXXH motif domain-containing protein [Paractinoplanes durhamensis]|uniref:HEXXH motif domain-containing protein n=1 Tax=Paractinoplanes durhamensis TaxID=113563 RepID=A0ABQ3Z5R5_9ACTN|nr:HEXXH motif domain-containing protein [Actinoplanes durhamensis]GIE05155.1 HEXXH motif domain-containing protein [Actinoplanes durhamensis]
MMTTFHRLPADLLGGLAASSGGVASSEALADAQLSKQLLLIADLLRRWPGPAAERDHVVALLEAARRAAPAAAARVLGSPEVGAWIAIVSRALEQGRAERADLLHIGAVAAAACAAAGVDAETEAPVRDGAVALPGIGRLTVGEASSARVTVAAGNLIVDAGHGPIAIGELGNDERWQPLRLLRAGDGGLRAVLALDDVDPYRHGYHAPPAPRLSPAEFLRWQDLFTEAWQLLAEHVPDRAAEVAAGLRALVPLQPDGHSSRSATIRHLYGVFGLTLPPTAADFAVTLVHEYQHAKLSAVLNLVQLSDPADERRYFAPWRTDPRPLAGLLQGVYAFAGVADTWRALRGADGVADAAEQEFADARLHVDRSLATLESSDALTPTGRQFATRLRQFTDGLLAEPVSDAAARRAQRHHDDIHQRWLAANTA